MPLLPALGVRGVSTFKENNDGMCVCFASQRWLTQEGLCVILFFFLWMDVRFIGYKYSNATRCLFMYVKTLILARN